MNKFLKRLFVFSLISYFSVTIYTRFVDSAYSDFSLRVIFSLPFDYMEGRGNVDVQICRLSKSEVAQLLRTNPDRCPKSSKGTPSQDYVVIRLKNEGVTVFGHIKCYFSCFPFPLVSYVRLPGMADNYLNLIYPFPTVEKENSLKTCDISVRWKNIGG